MTNKSLLITRPSYDPSTTYLFHWSKPVIKLAKQKKIKVIDLSGNRANKNDFTGRVEKINPSFIFFNGHGNERAVSGQDNEVLISSGENEDLLKNRIVFARSCSCAKKLGPKSISGGTKAFIGYKEPFIFMTSSQMAARSLLDETAKLFLEPSNKVATTLLKGHSALEADLRAKKAFKRNIRKLLTSESKKEDSSVLRFLFWDMEHQVCLGNPKASL